MEKNRRREPSIMVFFQDKHAFKKLRAKDPEMIQRAQKVNTKLHIDQKANDADKLHEIAKQDPDEDRKAVAIFLLQTITPDLQVTPSKKVSEVLYFFEANKESRTLERDKEIWEMRRQGRTTPEIAATYNISQETVRYCLRKGRELGMELEYSKYSQKPHPSHSEIAIRRDEIWEMWRQNHTAQEISSAKNISLTTVESDIKLGRKEGILDPKKRGRRQSAKVTERLSQLPELWNKGLKLHEIANIFGISRDNVEKYVATLRKQGVDIQRRKGRPKGSRNRHETGSAV
jgi:transposase